MPWNKIVIKGSDVAPASATAFVETFGKELRAAGFAKQRTLFRDMHVSAALVYFVSPEASAVAKDVFTQFSATECIEAPCLDSLKEINY